MQQQQQHLKQQQQQHQQQPQLETDQIAFGFRFGFGLSCASSRHRHRRDGVWSLYNPVNFFKVFSSHFSLPLWHHSLFGARAARLFHRFLDSRLARKLHRRRVVE